jgi:myo-inositol 2-dehydrogenase/D-chiro-inositol 1-dehydrogenase
MTVLGVGFLGAGAATQAIHLPTVAALGDRFRVVRVMDADAAIAGKVAAIAGASATTDVAAVLDDPDVDIVVIASPADRHAEQAIAACEAGKKAILCEKPLATSRADGQRILRAARSSGTPVVLGTMHAYDPACRAVLAAWRALRAEAELVRSSIHIPADDIYIHAATRVLSPPPPWLVPPRPWAAGLASAFVTDMMLGLTIHDIPLIRELRPTVDRVVYASVLDPIGYAMAALCGQGCVELVSVVTGDWDAAWQLEAWSRTAELSIEFPPSYVHAGSAVARLSTAEGTREWRYPENGYYAEWTHLADLAMGLAEPWISLDEAVQDLRFALDLADGAAGLCEVSSG